VLPEGSLSWGGIFHTKFWIDPSNDLIGVSMAQKFPAPKSDVHLKFKELVYKALID
jgi:CubicO group peptidase (beta-lactamase class C family)